MATRGCNHMSLGREIKTKLIISIVLILCCWSVFAQDRFPSISITDRIRLAEAFRLADEIGNDVWPGWSKAPFAVLLVTPDYEFLIRHPKPSDDFAKLAYDPVLKSDVYYRKRTFPKTFLATNELCNRCSNERNGLQRIKDRPS